MRGVRTVLMSIRQVAGKALAGAAFAATVSFGFAGLAFAAGDDPASCTEGVLTAVVDDNGVEHQACVAVEALSASVRSVAVDPVDELPSTGAGTNGALIGAALVISGVVASLVAKRRV